MHEEIRRAKETLARLAGIEEAYAADDYARSRRFEPLRHVRPTPTRKETSQMTQQPSWDDWNTWCRTIAGELVGELAEESGAAVGELEKRILALEQKVGELTAESHVRHSAEVFDLPDWRRKSNAA